MHFYDFADLLQDIDDYLCGQSYIDEQAEALRTRLAIALKGQPVKQESGKVK